MDDGSFDGQDEFLGYRILKRRAERPCKYAWKLWVRTIEVICDSVAEDLAEEPEM